jgi:hypothetical protein
MLSSRYECASYTVLSLAHFPLHQKSSFFLLQLELREPILSRMFLFLVKQDYPTQIFERAEGKEGIGNDRIAFGRQFYPQLFGWVNSSTLILSS